MNSSETPKTRIERVPRGNSGTVAYPHSLPVHGDIESLDELVVTVSAEFEPVVDVEVTLV
jgi:hypothetical protein